MQNVRIHRPNLLIERTATTTFGIIETRRLNALGFTNPMIHRMVANGELIRLYRGVYAVGHGFLSRTSRWYAAVRAAGEGAALAGYAAGQYWGIDRSRTTVIEVSVPKYRRPRRGFVSSVALGLANDSVQEGPMRVTSPARTIVDQCTRYPAGRIARMIREAQHLELVTIDQVEQVAIEQCDDREMAVLQDAIAIRSGGGDGTDSSFEDRVLAILATYPIAQPVPNVRYVLSSGRRVRVDMDWPGLGIVGEADGRFTHASAEQRELDDRRDAELAAMGIRTFRIGEDDFDADPHAAVHELVVAVTLAMAQQPARLRMLPARQHS
jgi:hypothetical protein